LVVGISVFHKNGAYHLTFDKCFNSTDIGMLITFDG